MLIRVHPEPGAADALAAAGAAAAGAGVLLSDRAPYPYAQHRLLDIPLPLLTRRRLDALLRPRADEQVLEIGPGTGLQSVHMAPQLGAGGRLAVVDVQQEMLLFNGDRAAWYDHVNITAHDHGGHFIPWEIPTEWVEDLRRTFRERR
jgi:hypothetical protein